MVHQLVQQIHFPEHHMARIKASHDLDQCSQIITYWLESRWRINPFLVMRIFVFNPGFSSCKALCRSCQILARLMAPTNPLYGGIWLHGSYF